MNKAVKIILEILLVGYILGFAPSLYGINDSVNKNSLRKKKEEIVEKHRANDYNKEFQRVIKQFNKEIRKVMNKPVGSAYSQKNLIYHGSDLTDEVLKKQDFVFNQDFGSDKRKVKSKLGISLSRTRNLECIITDTSYQNIRVQTIHNLRRKQHIVRSYVKLAGINTSVVLDSTRKPVLSASKTIKIGKTINITPLGGYSFEKQNLTLSVKISMNYFSAGFVTNKFPKVIINDYILNGNIPGFGKIRISQRYMCSPGIPESKKSFYNTSTNIKLNKHTTLNAEVGYAKGRFTNPSARITYSFKH